jgi:tetratricopeptide (TPR) repeat protein
VPDYRHLLGMAENSWGQQLLQDQKFDEAKVHLANARKALEKLHTDFPKLDEYRQELARCLNGLGLAIANGKEPAKGKEPLDKAYTLLTELSQQYKDNGGYRSDLESVARNLIVLHTIEAKRAEAAAAWDKADEHIAQASKVQDREASEYLNRALKLIDAKDYAAAAKAVDGVFQFAPKRWSKTPQAILVLARCTGLAGEDASLPANKRDDLARSYGKQTMSRIRMAFGQGVAGLDQVLSAPQLDAVRARGEFAKELKDIQSELKAQQTK